MILCLKLFTLYLLFIKNEYVIQSFALNLIAKELFQRF